jgi:hypothetical protein
MAASAAFLWVHCSEFQASRYVSYIMWCQSIDRQRLDKHPAICARNNGTNVYSSLLGNSQLADGLARELSRDLFWMLSAPRSNRESVFPVHGPCREDMREYGNGIDFTWVQKFQGNNSAARRRIRRLSVWRYMCYNYTSFGSVKTHCRTYDYRRSSKPIHQSKPAS